MHPILLLRKKEAVKFHVLNKLGNASSSRRSPFTENGRRKSGHQSPPSEARERASQFTPRRIEEPSFDFEEMPQLTDGWTDANGEPSGDDIANTAAADALAEAFEVIHSNVPRPRARLPFSRIVSANRIMRKWEDKGVAPSPAVPFSL